MAPMPPEAFAAAISGSTFATKYGATVDRDSAHERITTRVAAARQAAIEDAARAGIEPTTAGGLDDMTPAQQQREIARQQREIEAAQKRAAREAERQRKAEEREAAAAAKARQRTIDNVVRTGGRVATSRLGQDIIRGIFGTLFGGGRKR
jgi:hypothetical protein